MAGKALTVAFIGIDGAGKSTLMARVAGRLAGMGIDAPILKARTGRSRLERLGARQGRPGPGALLGGEATAMVMAALAWQAIGDARALRRQPSRVLLFDRYTPCVLALAGVVAPRAVPGVRLLLSDAPQADLTVFLDTPVEIARRRALERGGTPKSEAFLAAFDAAYRALPEWSSFVVLSAREPLEALTEMATEAILRQLTLRGRPVSGLAEAAP